VFLLGFFLNSHTIMAEFATPSAAAILTSTTSAGDLPNPAPASAKTEKPDETTYQAALVKAKAAFEDAKQARVRFHSSLIDPLPRL